MWEYLRTKSHIVREAALASIASLLIVGALAFATLARPASFGVSSATTPPYTTSAVQHPVADSPNIVCPSLPLPCK
jgi:hypothetical protein